MNSSIADDFLHLLRRLAGRHPLPGVRALHLPHEGLRSKDAEFCALELEDGSLGLSYVWLGDTFHRLRAGQAPLDERDALALAGWYREHDPVRRTLGFAAINALSQHLFAKAGWRPDETTDSLGLLHPAADDHVGMVGLFPPLVEQVLGAGARLTVLELRPELARDEGRYQVTLDRGALAGCNKVVSTSTVLLNDTLDAVLAACSGARQLSIVGPGAGCLPDPLFARGVSTVGGTRIVDREGFLAALAEGGKWGGFAHKYSIRREDYPGFDALLERL